MSENRCVCGQPITDRYLCQGCEIRLHNNLTELVDLNHELHTALTRMVRMSERGEGGRSAEKPLVFNQRAAETIRLIRTSLVSWVRELHEDTATPLPQQAAVQAMVEWLVPLLPEVAAHREDARELSDEIRHLARKAHGVVDLQPRQFALGPCPETPVEGERCPGRVRVFIPVEDDRPARVSCRTCRAEWTGEQWPRLYARISEVDTTPDPVLGIEDCAWVLGVGLSTIRRWLRLKLLTPARPRYVKLSDAWLVREHLRARRRERLAQFARVSNNGDQSGIRVG